MTEMNEKEHEYRKAMLSYLVSTSCFRQDLIAGKITKETLASWGLQAREEDGVLVVDLLDEH